MLIFKISFLYVLERKYWNTNAFRKFYFMHSTLFYKKYLSKQEDNLFLFIE